MKTLLIAAAAALTFAVPAGAQPAASHQNHQMPAPANASSQQASNGTATQHADHSQHAAAHGQPAQGGHADHSQHANCCGDANGNGRMDCCEGANAAQRPCCANARGHQQNGPSTQSSPAQPQAHQNH